MDYGRPGTSEHFGAKRDRLSCASSAFMRGHPEANLGISLAISGTIRLILLLHRVFEILIK